MGKRNETKPIQGWGWLGDAAEEAAVQAMAPARPSDAIKTKQKPGAGRARVSARVSVEQVSDDDCRRLAKQQYESEGKICRYHDWEGRPPMAEIVLPPAAEAQQMVRVSTFSYVLPEGALPKDVVRLVLHALQRLGSCLNCLS